MLSIATLLNLSPLSPQSTVSIWENTAEKKEVKMHVYLPPDTAGKAVPAIIVCPGGSYFWLDRDAEGQKVAEWLNANGIAAFVLEYRTAGLWDFVSHSRLLRRGNRFPDPLVDAQRALQIVRERSDEWGVNPDKTGIMGFSAGGHLALLCAELFDAGYLEQAGIRPSVSLRPDFAAAIYPVVSLTADCTHRRSRRGLLADRHDKTLRNSLSAERRARRDMPPVFIANCKDDPIVDCRNSELMDSALTAAGVSHLYLRFSTGGHGFGADKKKNSAESAAWMPAFIDWLNKTNLTEK